MENQVRESKSRICDGLNCLYGKDTILRLLNKVSAALDQNSDLHIVSRLILEGMAECLKMTKGFLTLSNQVSGQFEIGEYFGFTEAEASRGIYSPGEGIIGRVISSGKPVTIQRISESADFLNRTGSLSEEEQANLSFVSVPISGRHGVIGALSGEKCATDNEDLENDVQLLQIIASMISRTVELRLLQQEEIEMADKNRELSEQLKERFRPSNIIGNSKAMRQVYDLIDRISKVNSTVLILGESGVGKELVAHSIHYNGPREDKPFIGFNAAALPENLIESELFGHEKGAFTGATAPRKGRFESADGGSIFLDEIGELNLSVQKKLLRVLQEREIERLGSSKIIKVDVRVIAATNRDLQKMVDEGSFREDLYYRLNVFPITVPPLRERRSDILLLADHFVEKYAQLHQKRVRRISTPAIDLLFSYSWPGNIRELENTIERAILLTDDDVIHSYHLPPTLQRSNPNLSSYRGTLQQKLDSVEYEMIIDAMKANKGILLHAAKQLGMTERMLGLRIKKHGIDYRDFRNG